MLEIVHADVCGQMRVNSPSGARFFVTFIDDKSRWCEVFFLKHKSEVFSAFKKYKAASELLTGKKIKALQSDNGKEFCNHEFNKYFEEHGIKRRLSAPYTPQQNGTAERKNRTLVEMARCLLKQSKASQSFWAEAINTACYIRNRCPTRSLIKQIPYSIWSNKKATVAHMQIFGCKAFVLNKTPRGKFDSRSKECVFVGYASDAKAYRLWCPKTRNIIISRSVRFINEPGFIANMQNCGANTFDYLIECQPQNPPEEDNGDVNQQKEDARGRGRPRLLKDGRPGRPKKQYQPATTVNEQQEQQPLSAAEEEDQPIPSDNECNERNESEEESYESANFISSEDPTTVAEALSSDHSAEWLKALQREYLVQTQNKTWKIVQRPNNRKVIGCRHVFKTKESGLKKVRLVAKGCSQRPGEDFTEVFSPVVRPTSVRLLAALSAEKQLDIHQMDVVAAYLNGDMLDTVYMEVPERLCDFLSELIDKSEKNPDNEDIIKTANTWLNSLKNTPDSVCLIQKALYGLRQSGIRWYEKLSNKLREIGLVASKQDPCFFNSQKDDKIILLAIYVDDLLIASNDSKWIADIKSSLSKSFEMKDLGAVNTFLGINFVQGLNKDSVFMSQENYINLILKRFNMTSCNTSKTPIESQCRLKRPEVLDQQLMEKYPYQKLIGSLMYLAVSTRPDIVFSVNFLSQFNTCFNTEHWQAAKRVLKYLKRTSKFGLYFQKTGIKLYGFVDADWASDITDRRSYTGYSFIVAGAAVSWEARKQRTVALSSTESEYMGLSEAVKEAQYLKTLLNEINYSDNCIIIYNDIKVRKN